MAGGPLDFRILGMVEVHRGGQPIPISRRRERLLLGLLLLEVGRAVPVDRLISLLWEDELSADPRASLHTHMSRLRRQLALGGGDEPGVRLLARHSGYLADFAPDTIDAHRFTTLVGQARQCADPIERGRGLGDALALWRGPLLADVAADRLRERVGGRLVELRLAALTERIDIELAAGQHQRLIGELAALIAEHPDHETLTAQLMLALYRSGRQGEAIQAYQRLRVRLAEELGADPMLELREMYQAILSQDPDLSIGPVLTSGRMAAPVDVAPPTLRQLPPNRGEFVGREPELATLRGAVRHATEHPDATDPILIFTIEGMAGVGKTRFALYFAHELVAEGRYPDGQLYVDLRGFTPGQDPATPATVLEEFLSQLGVSRAEIPAGLAERAAMYRHRLAGRRVLVVLDNAADESQVQPLMPGSTGSLILITSRRILALDGATPIALETFRQPEALRLLATIAGADRVRVESQAAEELVARCGGLPLAVTLAAHRLRARPARRLADLVLRMEDERRRLTELSTGDRAVEAVFALSYQVLDADQRRMFRRLALHPGTDYSAYAAAVLGQATVGYAEALLDHLLREHLLQETAQGRYRFHDLVRAYALRCAHADESGTDRAAALVRLMRWYLFAADTADRVLDPPRRRRTLTEADAAAVPIVFDDPDAAMAWFESERANLVAVVETAGTLGADAVAWQLSAAMLTFLYLRSHFTEWLAVHRTALDAARRVGDQPAEAAVLNRLGVLHSSMHRPREAIGYHRRALAIRQDLDDQAGQAWTLNNLGVVHSDQGGYPEALECFAEAAALFRRSGDSRGEGLGLANLGDTHRRLGQPREAADCLRRALTVQQRSGDRAGCRYTHVYLGDLHHDLGEDDQAMREYRTALEIFRELGDRRGAATALAGLGRSLHATGQLDAARRCWSDALAGYDEINDPRAADMRRWLYEEAVATGAGGKPDGKGSGNPVGEATGRAPGDHRGDLRTGRQLAPNHPAEE
ncbi:BTAD domain-containing putative transcriptional regulator [Micromonospora sp. NPDC047074]|uniref:AfsR/SARP family transcriptional regulator n=1 Tax=Micromonospora sp. NPDC047074 TaxID=3154339 RepID=UPI00340B7AA1